MTMNRVLYLSAPKKISPFRTRSSARIGLNRILETARPSIMEEGHQHFEPALADPRCIRRS